MNKLIESNIGRYRLDKLTYEDDVFLVFDAFDTTLEYTVVLKLLKHSKRYQHSFSDRFLQETRALAQLSHPYIAKILDFGQDNDFIYMVLERIEGKPLSEWMGQKMAISQACDLIVKIADTLEYAHGLGVFHRDLRPENIIIYDDQPVIADFSIMRMIEEEETRELTGTNVGLGSPFYMSPEQGKGLAVDYRVDIYALGVIFYQLVTGKRPFEEGSGMEIVIQQVTREPVSPRQLDPSIPDHIDEVIMKALKKDPDDRFQSMAELVGALSGTLSNGHKRARGKRKPTIGQRVLGIILMTLITGAAYFALIPMPGLPTPQSGPVTLSPTVASTRGPTDIKKPRVNVTNTPPATAVPEIPSIYSFPGFPKLEGNGLFRAKRDKVVQKISKDNISNLQQIAIWGAPKIEDAVWTKNDDLLIVATRGGVYYYDPQSLAPKFYFDAKGWITTLAISEEGSVLATGDKDGMIRLWDAATGNELTVLNGHQSEIRSLEFSKDDKDLLLSSSLDRTARLWSILKAEEHCATPLQEGEMKSALFMRENGLFVSATSLSVHKWHIENCTKEAPLNKPGGQSLAIASDGKIIIGDQFGDVHVYQNGWLPTLVPDPSQAKKSVTALSMSPEKFVATGAADGNLRVYLVSNGKMNRSPKNCKNPNINEPESVISVQFSNSGLYIACLTDRGTISIWNIRDESNDDTRRTAPIFEIRRVVLSPDNTILLSETNQNLTHFWKISTGEVTSSRDAIIPYWNPFSYDGQHMLLLEPRKEGNAIVKWLVFFKDLSKPIYLPNGKVSDLATTYPNRVPVSFTGDGKKIISYSSSGTILNRWSTSTQRLLLSEPRNFNKCQRQNDLYGDFEVTGSPNGMFWSEEVAGMFCQIDSPSCQRDIAYNEKKSIMACIQINQKDDIRIWSFDDFTNHKSIIVGPDKAESVALSNNAELLAVGTVSGYVSIWDIRQNEAIELHQPIKLNGKITDMAFSGDDLFLIITSTDGTIRFLGIVQE